MIVTLSKDKTALVGMENGTVDENTAAINLVHNYVYLQDISQKIKFSVSDSIKESITNKGYLIFCNNNPFSFFKIKVKINGQ